MIIGSDTATTSMGEESSITPYHPLYLHQTDHPRQILISNKLTGSDNYGS